MKQSNVVCDVAPCDHTIKIDRIQYWAQRCPVCPHIDWRSLYMCPIQTTFYISLYVRLYIRYLSSVHSIRYPPHPGNHTAPRCSSRVYTALHCPAANRNIHTKFSLRHSLCSWHFLFPGRLGGIDKIWHGGWGWGKGSRTKHPHSLRQYFVTPSQSAKQSIEARQLHSLPNMLDHTARSVHVMLQLSTVLALSALPDRCMWYSHPLSTWCLPSPSLLWTWCTGLLGAELALPKCNIEKQLIE